MQFLFWPQDGSTEQQEPARTSGWETHEKNNYCSVVQRVSNRQSKNCMMFSCWRRWFKTNRKWYSNNVRFSPIQKATILVFLSHTHQSCTWTSPQYAPKKIYLFKKINTPPHPPPWHNPDRQCLVKQDNGSLSVAARQLMALQRALRYPSMPPNASPIWLD